MKSETQRDTAKRGRFISVIIAGSVIFWIAMNFLGPQLGLAGRYAILIDLMVAATLLWCLIVLLQIWRDQRNGEG